MSVRFTLEKRTNRFGECPIRLSWSFGGKRYQTTIGFSIMETDWDEKNSLVKPEITNQNGQSAVDINYYIKRIGHVVTSIEQHFLGKEKTIDTEMMKHAINDALSKEIARPEDILERCLEGLESLPEMETGYYIGPDKQYFKLICDTQGWYNTDRYYVLQQLFGRRDRISVPEYLFKPFRFPGQMYPTIRYKKVSFEEVYGQ
jgi:hypothetical protein